MNQNSHSTWLNKRGLARIHKERIFNPANGNENSRKSLPDPEFPPSPIPVLTVCGAADAKANS